MDLARMQTRGRGRQNAEGLQNPKNCVDVIYVWSHSQSGRKVPAESLQVRMGVFDRENPNGTGTLIFGVTEVISHEDYIGAVHI